MLRYDGLYIPNFQDIISEKKKLIKVKGNVLYEEKASDSPEVASASLSEVLASATKQLQEDAFLDVLVFIDGRSDGPRQTLVHVRLLRQHTQHLNAFGGKAWRLSV